ncbi:MAG: hypothetical protein COB02_15465 [Candidatus Cloacimonadota bacterium]|nr:MAG: hypothetical protein COB02_15465 [Candidatus Cloacimonadota bacterium]
MSQIQLNTQNIIKQITSDKKVLVIDDDHLTLSLVKAHLEKDYEITTSLSGLEGVKLALENKFSVIFLDYQLLDTTGLQVLKEIREKGISSQVILATGFPSYELAIEFNKLDVFDFLPKPFKIEKLSHTVNLAWDKYCSIKLNSSLQTNLISKNDELSIVNEKLKNSHIKLDKTLINYHNNIDYQNRLLQLIEVFQKIGTHQNLDELQKFIIQSVSSVLNADRSSLFIVDKSTNELYSKVAQGVGKKEIRFPIGIGIAGTVADNKQTILIPDAYQDSRFNPSFDKKTGYITKNILCMPMLNLKSDVIGVIQVLNKINGAFTDIDLNLLTAFNALAAMSLESVLASQEVKILNRNLQKALLDSQLVLDHINEGFCILNIDGNIRNGYSTICKRYFGVNDFKNFSIYKHNFLGFNKESNSFIKKMEEWIQLGFENPHLDFWEEMSRDIKLKSGKYILNLTFKRIGSKTNIAGIMLNLEDVTKAHNLAIESERQKKKSNLVLELSNSVLTHGQMQYYSYIQTQSQYIQEIQKIYANNKLSLNDIHKVFRAFHSFKSLVLTYGMGFFAEKIHAQEDLWMEIRDNYISEFLISDDIYDSFNELLALIDELEEIFYKLYPKSLLEFFDQSETSNTYQYSFTRSDLSYQAVSQLLKSEALLHAETLDKEIRWMTQKRNLTIPQNIWIPLRNVFSHLIKNSIDHGLESNEKRVKIGKSKVGYLFFDCFLSNQGPNTYITFIFKDDGQGINPNKIIDKALQKGLIDSKENINLDKAHNLIFLPGLSTNDDISLISGRGVGMDIVKETIIDLSGTIQLNNSFGKGLEVVIKIKVS